MNIMKKRFSNRIAILGLLIAMVMVFSFMGCASSPKGFDPSVKGPQMIVEPCTIRLGIVTTLKTAIVFKGKGFQPGDSVFVKLLDVYNGRDAVRDIPVADGNVDKKGNFIAKVGILVKVGELLNAKLGANKKMATVIVVTQPPIPEGVYTARAVSMESDKTAECKVVVKGPSMMDGVKDWLGGVLGKIKKK
ncbi:MAG: hypothetical protein GY849_01740 [Deltaproteobacteria bacterium]|nr:hypothetical protein [Deltaproteobacteria bacterium]